MAANPDYSTLFAGLDLLGLNTTLSTSDTPYTLFAPTNEAFADYNAGSNITNEEGARSPFLRAGYELLIVPEAILVSHCRCHCFLDCLTRYSKMHVATKHMAGPCL